MATFRTHNVRFYEPKAKQAHCVSYSSCLKLLALSREDSSIELWNFAVPSNPFLECRISGEATQGSVEALVWAGCVAKEADDDELEEDADEVDGADGAAKKSWKPKKKPPTIKNGRFRDDRLFSTGLHGLVVEHWVGASGRRPSSELQQTVWPVTSGAAWCMKFNRKTGKIAVGTEEGYICVFEVSEDGLNFDKVLDKQEGRILCLDWHANGLKLVTGSPDTIRIWDVTSGHPVARMSTGRVEKHRETTVWSVLLLNDMTIVSGDSRGKTSFWNGNTGTLSDSYQSHKADVLTVGCSKDQAVVYSSGVDPVIMHFQPIKTSLASPGVRAKWVKSVHRWANSHDVRAITCIANNLVVSVGVDANISVFDVQTKNLKKYPPLPHRPFVKLASSPRILALRYDSAIELWQLGEEVSGSDHEVRSKLSGNKEHPLASRNNCVLPLKSGPTKLVTVTARDDSFIESFDLTQDASLLCYVTTDGSVRILRLNLKSKTTADKDAVVCPSVRRIPFAAKARAKGEEQHRCNQVLALGNTDFLLGQELGPLQLFRVKPDDSVELVRTLRPEEDLGLQTSSVKAMVASRNFFALCDHMQNVVAVDLKSYAPIKVPKYLGGAQGASTVPVCSMAFHPATEDLFLTYANRHVAEISLESNGGVGKHTKFSDALVSSDLSTLLSLRAKLPSKGILLPPSSSANSLVMLYDEDCVCAFSKPDLVAFLMDKCVNEEQDPQAEPEDEDPVPIKQPKSAAGSGKQRRGNHQKFLQSKRTSINSQGRHLEDARGTADGAALHGIVRTTKRYQYLAHVGYVGCGGPDDENADVDLVVVEVKPQTLEAQLPPSLRQKKFGAM